MSRGSFVTRRLLLGYSAIATFLVPGSLGSALARSAPRARPRPEPVLPPRRVMLDPGHGGKDPGAIGYAGSYEKHIALAAALELMRQLEGSGRYRVALTRGRDVFIPLDGRVAQAEARRADLFISMHADAVPNHKVRGASVYTLSADASDPQTAALARRENSADIYGGPAFRGQSPEVAQILASLVRQETRAGSVRLARSVVSSLGRDVPLLVNPSRHAAFVVLKAIDIPSVLVEMGFMSNPQDEADLRQGDHRTRIAAAMKRAVDRYFESAGSQLHIAG
ncbi:MAG: N-acetylmuramoyl-L-alanine amidase [Acetobacteraceae bacterium]|nr:N-acetylmuramoyl-L-alanine amidase [Acetobacteraceae bacterium]MBV8589720.1 N-acetylmuramoyl-L-alanine amidase [Acetobacteraceae bacterium]